MLFLQKYEKSIMFKQERFEHYTNLLNTKKASRKPTRLKNTKNYIL